MKIFWIVATFSWPLSASAELVFVDYSGAVDSIMGAPQQYHVGDRISGQLVIDTALAPPNTSVFPPVFGVYGDRSVTSADFVRGFNPAAEESNDSVSVRNGASFDAYRVTDWRNGGDSYSGLILNVGTTRSLLRNVDIIQNFEMTPVDEPTTFAGLLLWGKGVVQRSVSFALDRFKVTPGHCRP